MIIQALKEYYERKASDPDSDIAPHGFERKELPFLIVIDRNGNFLSLEDTRENEGKKLVGRKFLLPRSIGRSGVKSYETTFLLWDHIGYVLGIPRMDDQKSKSMAIKQHKTWLDRLRNLPKELSQDEGVKAIIQFYDKGGVDKVLSTDQVKELRKIPGCNVSFRLNTDLVPVPCRDSVKHHVVETLNEFADENQKLGVCIVTGEKGVIVRTHGKTPINRDSNSLVGFQRNSGYDSYGKEQGYNAPMIKSTEFAYTTALKTLLGSKTQHILVGNTHTVFWSKKATSYEKKFDAYFREPERDDPDTGSNVVKTLFDSFRTGTYPYNEGNTPCYVLGLSPSSARIAVSYWEELSVSTFSRRIKEYFEDFSIVKEPNRPEYYPIQEILRIISPGDKVENIHPGIAGDLMHAILSGAPYPANLLQSALNRVRSDVKHRVTRVRAAIIKAYLNRYYRFYYSKGYKVISLGLDVAQPSIGYQLGRLFATLEKIQERASPGLNATIRERYYGAACMSPVTVFPTLLRLKNHHLSKIENRGNVVYYENLLGEIMGKVKDLPDHLDLHEQGLFAIGYYHQRQDFYRKKGDKNEKDVEDIQNEEDA